MAAFRTSLHSVPHRTVGSAVSISGDGGGEGIGSNVQSGRRNQTLILAAAPTTNCCCLVFVLVQGRNTRSLSLASTSRTCSRPDAATAKPTAGSGAQCALVLS